MSKELIKQDINLLEYPLWFQDECEAEKSETGFTWRITKGENSDTKEFVLKTSFKPPVKTDLIFLLYLLMQSQNQSWKDEIKLSRYQILKQCGLSRNTQWYDRLEESLERWKKVEIQFNGAFYKGKEYETLHFGVVDSWGIEKETKKLRIRFSPEYLSMVQNTAYYRFLNFNQVKALRSPLATRLYQLLVKTFKNRDTWEIDSVLLAEKIPMKQKFPAHIVLKIKPAMNRIYKYTDLKVTVEERKKARGEIILVFTKEAGQPKERPQEKKTPAFVMPESDEFKKLVSMLPRERQRQKTLLETVLAAFTAKGFDYVAWNIRYANEKARGNYPAYLLKSLRGNFAEVMREEMEIRQAADSKRTEEVQARQIKLTEAQTKEARESAMIQDFLKSLPPTELEAIELEAHAKLPSFLKKPIEEVRKENHVSFRCFIRLVALKRIKAQEAAKPAPQQPELAEVVG